jgi:recombination protein RecT
MTDTTALRDKVSNKATGTAVANKDKPKTLEQFLESYKPQFEKALSKTVNTDRFVRNALTMINSNPTLKQCTPLSLIAGLMTAAQFNLEPGAFGHFYLVPYQNHKINQYEAEFQLGYKGMIQLAQRSGEIKSISVHPVYEGEKFDVVWGIDEKFEHVPRFDIDRTTPKFWYTVVHFVNGGHHTHIMSISEIEKHRERSKADKFDRFGSSPWKTDLDAMCMKTVIRAASKFWPMSTEYTRQVESSDGTIKHEVTDELFK